MFVVMYDLRAMPAGHQTFLRQRTFSVPVRRDTNNQTSRKPLALGQGRTLRYLIHLRWDGCYFCLNTKVEHIQQHPCLYSHFHAFGLSFHAFLPLPTSTRFQSSKSGKIYLHRDIRLLFSRKSMEVDSGAAYELQSFTESPVDPPYSSRCWGLKPSLLHPAGHYWNISHNLMPATDSDR